MRKWWDVLCSVGPKYGYYPLASKTILIVKEAQKDKAIEIFEGTGVTITTEGERHMGAVIGSEDFKQKFVENKISKWISDIEVLAEIARDEPQAVYASFTKAISHRWTFLQRTVPNISHLFEPLEKAICETLILAIVSGSIYLRLRMENIYPSSETRWNGNLQPSKDSRHRICRVNNDYRKSVRNNTKARDRSVKLQ